MQENQIGFSLAELLFTIVITVILVTVAFVSYQSYIRKCPPEGSADDVIV